MKTAIITVAGISSRFNRGIAEENKVLKAIYSEGGRKDTLLYHLLKNCAYADSIVLVGGYRFSALTEYVETLRAEFPQVVTVFNEHYAELGSGYSLYLGVKEALRLNADEALFAEGDLDVDRESFAEAAASSRAVLTYTNEPIYANKAVVLYENGEGRYKYAFNSAHGLLTIDEPFSCILNSGQIWKFTDMEALDEASELFFHEEREDTNLAIIRRYVDNLSQDDVKLVRLKQWTNCNTRDDYRLIMNRWRSEQ
ncbi:MAG: hypothetical protein J5449_08175 [Oscillospiraceae bacterium]|nr:hypothetical protein [Oscillospiraceae bacterium]